MVNRLSASASEIFAGAIQDYGLGVVVGSQTFGKGTVQSLIPLHRGELKLTERYFYRISGIGTEQNGVVPDVAFPVPEGRLRDRETTDAGAIDTPFATVPPTSFATLDRVAPVLETLRLRHAVRSDSDAEFTYLRARKARLERAQRRTALSLHEETRRAEKEADDQWFLDVENARLVAKGETPAESIDELNERREAESFDEPAPEDDALVLETANILVDFIELSAPFATADASLSSTPTLVGSASRAALQ